MSDGYKYFAIVIVFLSLLISVIHFLIFEQQAPYVVLEELYYIPLLFGALMFGMKGAILSYLIVSVAYFPFFYGGWETGVLGVVDRALHILFSGFFAFLAGFFVERLKRQQIELERNRYLSNLGQVAATIVHDLKNPLITILGFARRIQEGKGNIATAAVAITESAENMQRIMHSVLDLAKPVRMELKEEDMRNVVRQATEVCMAKAAEKGVTLSINTPNIPITLEIDSFTLQRALVNLINNAIEASVKGQDVEIAVLTKKRCIAITIKDHGAGMDRETLDNIFVPFYSRKSGGTGLGMAIAKKIVDGHLGRILIDSQPRKGTELTVEIPYNLQAEARKYEAVNPTG